MTTTENSTQSHLEDMRVIALHKYQPKPIKENNK